MRTRILSLVVFLLVFALPSFAADGTIRTVGLVVSADPRVEKLFQSNLRREVAKLDGVVLDDPQTASWVILVKAMPIKSGNGTDLGWSAAAVTFLERVRSLPSATLDALKVKAIGVEGLDGELPWVNVLRDQVVLVVGDDYVTEVSREIAMRFDAQVIHPQGATAAAASSAERTRASDRREEMPEFEKPKKSGEDFPEFEPPPADPTKPPAFDPTKTKFVDPPKAPAPGTPPQPQPQPQSQPSSQP